MKKYIDIIIILILFISSLISLVYAFTNGGIIDLSFLIGMITITLIGIYKLINTKKKLYILGFILFLGTFSVIKFSIIDSNQILSINGSRFLAFRPLILVLFIVYIAQYKEVFQKYFRKTK